jgi:eukaryotic-like serine/threonine-protein kinase
LPELHSLAKRRVFARVGTTLKRKWRIVRLLGVGGMAAVYEAVHANGSRVAIKALHVELSVEEELRERFLREGYAANKVEHAGAVRVLDDDVAEDGSVFLIMELLEGETLAARAQRLGKVDEASALAMADKLLDVLAAAHDRGIVHRDVKPENVFITRDGSLKLLDFGVARVREATTLATHTGSTLGTPAFMSPEQARGRAGEVDARADVWAVGATMFNILSGELVHPGETANEQLVQAMTEPARPLAKVVAGASSELARFVDRALAFSVDDRWPSARAMQAGLREVWSKTQPGPLPERLTPAPASASPNLPVDRDASTMGPEELAEHAPTLALGTGALATARALTISSAAGRGSRGVRRAWWFALSGVAAMLGVGLSVVIGHFMSGAGMASLAGGGVVVPPPLPATAEQGATLTPPPAAAASPVSIPSPASPHAKPPLAATLAPPHPKPAAPPTRDKLLDQWH